MEGNDCYKFSTIQNYVCRTESKPIRVAVDIGCNLGHVTQLMRQFFPEAFIFAIEPVWEYYERACQQLRDDSRIKVLPLAVTASHRFADDLGTRPYPAHRPLRTFRGLPQSGPGWVGGSMILRAGERPEKQGGYEELTDEVNAVTMDELINSVCQLTGATEVDYVKMDCEGSENSSLGCACPETLGKIRYLSGEYHDIDRFYDVMRGKLYHTHHVNLVGDRWGSFFAERHGSTPTILSPNRSGMLAVRPWMSQRPVDWNVFREEFVLSHELVAHGL